MIALIAAGGALFLLAVTLLRLYAGPTLYDRALAVSSIVAKAVLVCAALAAASGRTEAVDAALALTLGALVLNAAVFKFFRAGTFQAPLVRAGED
jgi:multicomponent Na+:H+ antiporter subunit F